MLLNVQAIIHEGSAWLTSHKDTDLITTQLIANSQH
jgi:hypothetical protein